MTTATSRISRRMAVSAALLCIVSALNAQITVAQGVTDTLALEKGAAPGGGTYENLSLVKLNDFGQVAFQAYTDVNFIDVGIFRAQRGSPAFPIVRTGQTTGNGTFQLLEFHDLNNAGQVVFSADLAGTSGGGADDFGIFYGSAGPITEVIRTGVPLSLSNSPTGQANHTLDGLDPLPFHEGPTINDWGQVAFKGHVSACEPIIGGCQPVSYDAVMRSNVNGTVTLISTEGAPTPLAGGGTSGTMDEFVAKPLSTHPTTIINNSGRVLFRAIIDGPSEGIFWANVSSLPFSTGTRLAVARDGQTLVPGAPGTIDVNSGALDEDRFAVDMNDAGEVAFTAELNPGNGINPPDWRLYRWSPVQAAQAGAHGLTEIAHVGQMSPDGDGTLGVVKQLSIQMNERGQVAFSSLVTSAAYNFNDEGVYRGDGQTLNLIARRGQLTPDGQFRFRQFLRTGINDAGQVVFDALLADPNDENLFAGVGLFLADGIEVIEVMQPGRTLAGSTVNDVSWSPKHGVNSLGQVAYLAGRTNNLDGAFLFTLEDIHWRTTGSGNWDNSPNWTVSTQPGYVHNVSIDPNMTVAVAGPAANLTVKSLVVGKVGGAGQPTLNLQAGVTLTATDAIDLKSNSVLDFQIGGTGPANIARLVTGGTAALDGMLKVSLLGPFLPAAGNSFDILDWNVAPSGAFTSAQLPMLAAGLMWNSSQLYTTGILSVTILGDYNGNGTVDAADYVLWRKSPSNFGGDPGGYYAWRAHFGQSNGSSAAIGFASNSPLPEPSGLALLTIASASVLRYRKGLSHHR